MNPSFRELVEGRASSVITVRRTWISEGLLSSPKEEPWFLGLPRAFKLSEGVQPLFEIRVLRTRIAEEEGSSWL